MPSRDTVDAFVAIPRRGTVAPTEDEVRAARPPSDPTLVPGPR